MSWIERSFCQSSWWTPMSRRMLSWAIADQHLRGTVLEIGCGNGNMAKQITQEAPGIALTATDIDPLMIVEARKNLPQSIPVRAADATALPFEAESFDNVISLLMLHHVIEWESALEEAFRVLRPGGKLIGYDLTKSIMSSFLHTLDRSPFRMVSPEDFVSKCKEAGFKSVKLETDGFGQVMRFSAIKG